MILIGISNFVGRNLGKVIKLLGYTHIQSNTNSINVRDDVTVASAFLIDPIDNNYTFTTSYVVSNNSPQPEFIEDSDGNFILLMNDE